MAETTITLSRLAGAIVAEDLPANNIPFASGTVVSNVAGSQRILLAQFSALSDSYKYSKLVKAWLGGGADPQTYGANLVVSKAAAANLASVTWESRPDIDQPTIGGKYLSASGRNYFNINYPFPEGPWPYAGAVIPPDYTASEASYAARDLLNAPTLAIWCMGTSTLSEVSAEYLEGTREVLYEPSPFVLKVVLDPSVTILSTVAAKKDTPSSGYLSPYEAHTFEWEFVSSDSIYTCAGAWSQASATFYYRNGTSGSWTSVSKTTDAAVNLPASTFVVGTFQWYVTATDHTGRTTTSPVYTLTTADSLPTCTPTKPVNTIEDGSKPIVFNWQVSIDTGTAPTGADLEISSDGSVWSTLGNVSGNATTWTAAANTIPAGSKCWRVRSYNVDGVAGDWSAPAGFVSIAAPPAPVVSADAVPFATLSWQSEGQQAYRVTVDGRVYGPYFGSAKSFEIPDYLSDGGHTAAVEIQGSYGLWSNPGTVSFTVTNVPGAPITLRGIFYRDAELNWSTEDQAADFVVYRDGVRIGHTARLSFVDRTVLGAHVWQVINRLPGGYYTASNIVQGELRSCCTAIAPLDGGAWLELRKSANESSEQSFAASRQISLRHFEGAAYPVAEISPFFDLSGSYDVAFLYGEEAAAARFEAMLGQSVILKSRGGECLVGILSALAKRNPRFYRAYSFNVQRIHWGDYIDADD